jgi:hypothetical protein
MKQPKHLFLIGLVIVSLALAGCSAGPSTKDVVGKWTNTKSPHIWMEFFADMTCSGGKWSLAPDGTIKIVNPDGNVVLAKLKDGKLVIAEFGEYGIYSKEGKQ